MSDILFETTGHVGLITLNRPKALNSLTFDMITAMQEALSVWETDDAIKAVVVKSNSQKAFCAGGDVVSLYERGREVPETVMPFFEHEYILNRFIYDFKKPYIALLNGITMGGGVGISMHGKFRVATENFSFAMPETALGFFPDVGGSFILGKLNHNVGIYLGLTGKRLKRDDAIELDLITHAIDACDLDEVVQELVSKDLSNEANERISEILDKYTVKTNQGNLSEFKADISEVFNGESLEQCIENLNQLNNDWASKTILTLKSKSPLALKVTFSQIKKGQQMSMHDCMAMEYRLVTRFMQGHDFFEGVRALLIDKDNHPKWDPKELSQVTDIMVNKHFLPLKGNPLN